MELHVLKRIERNETATKQSQAVISALQANPHGLSIGSVQRICGVSHATAKVLLRTHAVCLKDKYYPKPKTT